MRLFLWDVKSKTWNTKKAKFSATLCEFNQGSFGLGFEWYHNKSVVTTRYGHFTHLVLHFLWVEVIVSAEWGPHKARYDKLVSELRAINSGGIHAGTSSS